MRAAAGTLTESHWWQSGEEHGLGRSELGSLLQHLPAGELGQVTTFLYLSFLKAMVLVLVGQ